MFDAFFDIYVRKANIASDEFSENCTNLVKKLENIKRCVSISDIREVTLKSWLSFSRLER